MGGLAVTVSYFLQAFLVIDATPQTLFALTQAMYDEVKPLVKRSFAILNQRLGPSNLYMGVCLAAVAVVSLVEARTARSLLGFFCDADSTLRPGLKKHLMFLGTVLENPEETARLG